ncbi:MAG: cold-shock protein [Acidimicrobiia bacterium]
MDGVVIDFDDHRGLGTIEADGRRHPFHCTAIADGTRTIEVGTPVSFTLAPGPLGRWEARDVGRRERS